MRDVNAFLAFAKDKPLERTTVLDYKRAIFEKYSVSSVNSMLAALNSFFAFLKMDGLRVKRYKEQRRVFCEKEKELTKSEYLRLLSAAEGRKNERLSFVLQTICACGIRVSELSFITAEAVKRGEATVNLKGKTRRVFIVNGLRKKLLRYVKAKKIRSGAVFVTRRGKPIDRHSVWREMKGLCRSASVKASKVFPHNLRHLFARQFYSAEKDIVKLADILGHSSVETTRIYVISTGDEHRRRMEGMRLIN